MKRTNKQRDEIATLLFSLNDNGVEFRNRWRGIAGLAVWIVLSGFTMVLAIFGVQERLHLVIVIGMSLFKYVPLLFVIYELSKRMAAKYLDDVYELHDENLAAEFLEEVTFGYGHEKITINDGKIPEKDERSSFILIGGPGKIQVNLDSVALLEKVNGEPEVIYPRSEPWTVGRFERIREIGKHDAAGKREYAIINLRDQFVGGLSVKSRSKDGIPIEAQDIKVIFSILRRQQTDDAKVQGDAYLFEPKAVEALVYNQTTITPMASTQSGVTFPWDTTIIPLVHSELEELITSRTLSEILATISQKELDLTSNNEHTIAQMRVEMTGQHNPLAEQKKEARPPNFESRSKITAQFYDKAFKEKAAKLGVSLEWIDIGTWQLPSEIILEKHKEALTLARENAKKRAAMERSRKKHELAKIISLIDGVIISNYEKNSFSRKITDKEIEKVIRLNAEAARKFMRDELNKKDANAIALEILKAFRKELLASKRLIENENRSPEENRSDLARIDKALYDISHLTNHWI